MSGGERSWLGLVREIGISFTALLRAEFEALVGDLTHTGRSLVRLLVLAGAVAAVVFWSLGLLLYLGVELLALVLPRWGAAAVLLGLLLLTAAGLAVALRRRWTSLESPADTVRRRLDDQRRWWRRQVEGESADDRVPERGMDRAADRAMDRSDGEIP